MSTNLRAASQTAARWEVKGVAAGVPGWPYLSAGRLVQVGMHPISLPKAVSNL